MTLFIACILIHQIACILIHQFGMAWWWYPVAMVIWLMGLALQYWWTHEDNRLMRRER